MVWYIVPQSAGILGLQDTALCCTDDECNGRDGFYEKGWTVALGYISVHNCDVQFAYCAGCWGKCMLFDLCGKANRIYFYGLKLHAWLQGHTPYNIHYYMTVYKTLLSPACHKRVRQDRWTTQTATAHLLQTSCKLSEVSCCIFFISMWRPRNHTTERVYEATVIPPEIQIPCLFVQHKTVTENHVTGN